MDRLILNGANLNSRGVRPSVQLPIEIGYHIASRFAGKDPKAKRKAELLRLMVKDPDLHPEQLAAVPLKTLVIAGTRDMIKRRHTEQIWRSLPNAELVWIHGDHFIAAKHPREFNQAVEQFLQNSKNK